MEKKSLLISFSSFPEHIPRKIYIYNYPSNVLLDFQLFDLFPFITDSAVNMLKLRENYYMIVCFAHWLNTGISNSFKEVIKTNNNFGQLHSTIIEVIKYINKASNLQKIF